MFKRHFLTKWIIWSLSFQLKRVFFYEMFLGVVFFLLLCLQINGHEENLWNHIGGIGVDGVGILHRQERDARADGVREPVQPCRHGVHGGVAAHGGFAGSLLRSPRQRQRADDGALPTRARTP